MAAEPLIEVSGARSSWLTMLRNSAPQPLQFLEWRQVLHGDHHRRDRTVLGVDRRRVDQHRHAAPVGHRQHDFLGAYRLGVAQLLRERELIEGDLAAVGKPAGHDLEQLLHGLARHAQALHEPPRLAVQRDRPAGGRVEHDDRDRRGVDQRLEVGAGAPLVTVGARMGNRRGRLRGEQQQDLLVPVREGRPAFLLHEVEIADMHPAMAQRRALEGLRRQDVGREAE